MRERPLPFRVPMVRATLDDRKAMTRRLVKLPEGATEVAYWAPPGGRSTHGWADPGVNYWTAAGNHLDQCPYGQPGDRLWVREAWKAHSTFNDLPPRDIPAGTRVFYLADSGYSPNASRYRHARFMPRWASRITLEITSVRVERLQDISKADAIAEGLIRDGDGWRGSPELPWFASPIAAFRSLWESIHGIGSWDDNPWVWVVEFRRIEQPEAS